MKSPDKQARSRQGISSEPSVLRKMQPELRQVQRISYGRCRGLAGFSLMELLVVLLILSIFAAVAAPATSRLLAGLSARQEIQKIIATLHYARLTAISKGKTVRVGFDETSGRGFELTGAVEETRSFDLGDDGRISMEPKAILFFPEGHATPASLEVTVNTRTRKIHIDLLTAMPITD